MKKSRFMSMQRLIQTSLKLSLSLVFSVLVFAGTTQAAIRYVNPDTGDDMALANDCTNISSPCATIYNAQSQASDGDTIDLAAGIYSGAGTAVTKALNFVGVGNSTELRDIGPVMLNAGIVGATELRFQDLKITFEGNSTAYLNLTDGSGLSGGVVFDNVIFDYSGNMTEGYCIAVQSGVTKVTIQNSTIVDCSDSGSNNFLFKDNGTSSMTELVVTGNTFAPDASEKFPKISVSATESITFSNNTIQTGYTGDGGTHMILVGGGSGVNFTANNNTIGDMDGANGANSFVRFSDSSVDISTITMTDNDFEDWVSDDWSFYPIYNNGNSVGTLNFTDNSFRIATAAGSGVYPANVSLYMPGSTIGSFGVSGISGNNGANLALELDIATTLNGSITENTLGKINVTASDGLGSSNLSITKNKIIGSESANLIDVDAYTVNVDNNIVTNDLPTGTMLGYMLDIDSSTGTHSVQNNTFITAAQYGVINVDNSETQTIKNNIFRAQETGFALTCQGSTVDNVSIENNNFYFDGGTGNSSGEAAPEGVSNSGTAACTYETTGDTANILDDPDFDADETGTSNATSSLVRTISQSGANFTADELAGKFLELTIGAKLKYFYVIANTTEDIIVKSGFGSEIDTIDSAAYRVVSFNLAETSALVDAGAGSMAGTDIDGDDRSQGGSLDIGAQESPYTNNTAPEVSGIQVDGVGMVGIGGGQTNAGTLPTISWTFTDGDDDTQASYNLTICAVAFDLIGNCNMFDTILATGNVMSADTSYNLATALTAATSYYIKLIVSDGTSTDTDLSASFSTGTPAVTVSTNTTTATEGGATGSFTVVLATIPRGEVTVGLSADADSSLSATSLTFTRENWSTAQTVTVTAVNDSDVENGHTSTITIANATSSGADYNNLTASHTSVTVTITDNDTAPVADEQSAGTGGGGSSRGTSSQASQSQITSNNSEDSAGENGESDASTETASDSTDAAQESATETADQAAKQSGATATFEDTEPRNSVVQISPTPAEKEEPIRLALDQEKQESESTNQSELDKIAAAPDRDLLQDLFSGLSTEKESEELVGAVKTNESFEQIASIWKEFKEEKSLENGNSYTANLAGSGKIRTKKAGGSYKLTSGEKDSDEDGLPDVLEIGMGSNPFDADSDKDGFKDGFETLDLGTSPTKKDNDTLLKGQSIVPKRKHFNREMQLNIAAEPGSEVKVFLTKAAVKDLAKIDEGDGFLEGGENFRASFTGLSVDKKLVGEDTADEQGIALVLVKGLPVGEEVNLTYEITKPDGSKEYQQSGPKLVKLPEFGDNAGYKFIDEVKYREQNASKTYVVTSKDPFIEFESSALMARVNFESLVFGSVILADTESGVSAIKIPTAILKQPGVHNATLTLYDPVKEEYSDPQMVAFLYKPVQILPELDRDQFNLLNGNLRLTLYWLIGLALAGAISVEIYSIYKRYSSNNPTFTPKI
jgi:hypothetical protein